MIAAVSLAVVACVPQPKLLEQLPEAQPTDSTFQASFDVTWDAVMQSIAEWPLTVIEKESGIINTDWTTRMDSLKMSFWRGVYGGQVEEDVPTEVMERINVVVRARTETATNVRIIRYVKFRIYEMAMGPVGSFTRGTGEFTQTNSNTLVEARLLDRIGSVLAGVPLD